MNSELLHILLLNETDIDGALARLNQDEQLYCSLLSAFIEDTTMDGLIKAIANQTWDDAFTAAHALKGLAGNMGFVPLFHKTGELVLLIRDGRIEEIEGSLKNLIICYNDIVCAIRNNL